MPDNEDARMVVEIDIEGDLSEFCAALGIGGEDSDSNCSGQGEENAKLSQGLENLGRKSWYLVIGAFLLGWMVGG